MVSWVYNSDGTISFETFEYGTITVGAGYVIGTPLEGIDRPNTPDPSSSYHEYEEVNYLGIAVGSIDPTDLYSALAAYPTPFGPNFAGPGWVTHQQIDPAQIANFTATSIVLGIEVPAHLLQPGVVIRQIVVIDGQYAIRTFGIGTGFNWFNTNVKLADAVWTFADSRLVGALVESAGWQIVDSVSSDGFFRNSYVGQAMLQSIVAEFIQDKGIGESPIESVNAGNLIYAALNLVLFEGGSISVADLNAIGTRLLSLEAEGVPPGRGAVLYLRAVLDEYNERNGTAINECFLAGTSILLQDSSSKPVECILPNDIVLSYDASGTLVPGRVTRTFQNEVSHILDVHGLKVTPGHATFCGEGMFKGRHVPIIDILLSDGALVQTDGTLIRMAINAPAGSLADAFVKVAVAATPEDIQRDTLAEAEMRVGTLLFDREGVPVSVLDCLTAEGYAFDPGTGLIAKPGEAPHPLFWFGRLPRPEDYILTRSQETLEGILTDGEWEGSRSALIEGRLRQTKMMRVN